MFTSTCEINPVLECESKPLFMERKWEPKIEIAPNCPRCASSNTKFCYYNNYSLSQPRYFCKGCKRYWTKGGLLRNVPVGGGCRKSRRAKSARGVGYARPGPSHSQSSNESENATNGAEIDIAAVFAKYLSQDSAGREEIKAVNDQESSSGTCSGSLEELLPLNAVSTDTCPWEEFMFEYQKASGLTDGLQFDEGLPQVSVGENFESLLELHTMIGDHEMREDMLWSEGTSMQNLAWQPMVQLEDLGSFSTDDDHNLKMSSNVVSNNWSSSFDLSSFEIFSRP